MKMNSTMVMGAILAVTMFGSGMIVYRLIMDVRITNFPLDKNGNLKISVQESSKIMLVYNQTLTLPPDLYGANFYYLTTFNTSNFKYARIMAKAQGSYQPAGGLRIYFYESNYGILTGPEPFKTNHFWLDNSDLTGNPGWGTGSSHTFEIHATSYALYFTAASNIGFDGRLIIIVHLTS